MTGWVCRWIIKKARGWACVSWRIVLTLWAARSAWAGSPDGGRMSPVRCRTRPIQRKKMATKIKVLLVDDHPLVREGLVNLINQQPDLEICGEAGNEPVALQMISELRPDVAVVDISLENGSGIELLKS